MYMPASLPACAMFKEVGCYTIDGDIVNPLMVDSPDGLIEIQHTDGCCNEDLMTGVEQNMSTEIKSPYLDPMQMPVYYNIPRGYVIQILSHMKVTGTETNLYVSVGSNSVCIIECAFHKELWNEVWGLICDRFDTTRPKMPKRKLHVPKEFIPKLDRYIDHSTFLISELPIVHRIDGKLPQPRHRIPHTRSKVQCTMGTKHR